MNKEPKNNEMIGKKLLSLLVVSGLSISGISFLMLENGVDRDSIATLTTDEYQTLCDSGLCYEGTTDSIPVGSFTQQAAVAPTDEKTMSNTEIFTSLKPLKGKATFSYEISDGKATLFASKDSFVREGIKNSNEGSNEVLRVMGTGPTNNRALIAFDQADIQSALTDKNLESASLKLFIVSNDGKWEDGRLVNAHMLVSNWIEGSGANAPFSDFVGSKIGATWNCSTDVASCVNEWEGGKFVQYATDSVMITNDISGQWIELDVTDDVKSFTLGSSNYGWLIMKNEENSAGRINFAAREAHTNIPQLELIFS